MKYQILFSQKNKKNISLSSAESAHSMVRGSIWYSSEVIFLISP